MRRLILLLIFNLSGVAVAQPMSDDQVVKSVKSSQQIDKILKQITTELMRRGVTKEQVERIQQKYEGWKSTKQIHKANHVNVDSNMRIRKQMLIL